MDNGEAVDETPGPTDLDQVIRLTERRRLRSLIDVDMAVAELLHDQDFQLITPRGLSLSKREYLGLISSGELSYSRFEPVSDIEVLVGGNVTALRYRSWIENAGAGGSFSALCWHTDCYRHHDGRWQVTWSQATEITG